MARFSLAGRKGKKSTPESTETTPLTDDVGTSKPPSRPKVWAFLTGGFRDPRSRARFIIWTGVGVLAFAVFMILALGATSTYWFCANVCHKVQDDTIIAYNRSSHDKISCMACHEPVNAAPWVFVMAKAEALGELYLTATNQYELPLNGDSHVSEEMPSEQCTQCHAMQNRTVTPTHGVIMNHEIHETNDIKCPECHNRVAHRENFELTLKIAERGAQPEARRLHDDGRLLPLPQPGAGRSRARRLLPCATRRTSA